MEEKLSYKISAKMQMKQMDMQEKVQGFIASQRSAKGTTEEGTNTYAAIVIGVIVLAISVPVMRTVFGNIMDFFQDGTTKTPANWS